MLKEYVISYLVANAFSSFVIYLFYEAVFEKREPSLKIIKALSYVLFTGVISILYLLGSSETVMLISNIVGLFSLTLLYKGKVIQKIVFSFTVYGILMAIEVVVYLIYHNMNYHDSMLEKYNYSIALATIVDLLSFIAVLIFRLFRSKHKRQYLPTAYWVVILILPVSLLLMTYGLSKNGVDTSSLSTIICFLLILVIEPVIFILYDLLSDKYQYQIEKILFENNISHYQNQISVISKSELKAKEFTHNINNHLQGLMGYIDNNDINGSKKYLEELLCVVNKNNMINTGNSSIDSMINYKVSIMDEKEISFSNDLYIPENLKISNVDITALLGNLLDNAIEAAEKTEKENRFVSLYMRYDKSNIIITVKNSYSGELEREDGVFKSLKSDKDNHGIGLKSINQVIEKYDGLIKINTKNNIFTANVLLYL